MDLTRRINLLAALGEYMKSDNEQWMQAKEKAYYENNWFTPEFINLAVSGITENFLDKNKLEEWTKRYAFPEHNPNPKLVGIVMAGNIPLVGFHDFLCVFISGHRQLIKPASKDEVLIKHLSEFLFSQEETLRNEIDFASSLKECDAYIATGSNNTSRYFDYYFGKYPNISRKNRTGVAIITGDESDEELSLLTNDICQYFGLGCRNVTKLYVPDGYNFEALINALHKYDYLFDHHKYKNNYDYQLAILMLNNKYYMTNSSVLLTENESLFSPISVVHYTFYTHRDAVEAALEGNREVQLIVSKVHIPFGQAQEPKLTDYADGIDTLQFLRSL